MASVAFFKTLVGKAAAFIRVKGGSICSTEPQQQSGSGHVIPECRSDSSEVTTEQHDNALRVFMRTAKTSQRFTSGSRRKKRFLNRPENKKNNPAGVQTPPPRFSRIFSESFQVSVSGKSGNAGKLPAASEMALFSGSTCRSHVPSAAVLVQETSVCLPVQLSHMVPLRRTCTYREINYVES